MTTPTPHKPVALAELPVVAFARRWFVEGETPKKQKNENGRWAWPARFKYHATTQIRVFDDDASLTLHAEATRLVADLRDENERLRALLDKHAGTQVEIAQELKQPRVPLATAVVVSVRLLAEMAQESLAALKEKSA